MSSRDSQLMQYANKSTDVSRTETSSLDAMLACKAIIKTENKNEITGVNDKQEHRDSEIGAGDIVDVSGATTAKERDGVKSVTEISTVESELEKIKSYLMKWLEDHDYFEDEDVNAGTAFAEMGLSSIDSVTLSEDVRISLGVELDATVAWQYPNIGRLSKHISELKQKHTSSLTNENKPIKPDNSNIKKQRSSVCTAMEDLSLHEVAKSLKELIFGPHKQKDSVGGK